MSATAIRPPSMNEASDKDPFNNNCYGTIVDQAYKLVSLTELEQKLGIVPDADREMYKAQWSRTKKYYDAGKKKVGDGGMFQIIIDPSKCKGCAECVTVCDDDALKMVNKTDEIMTQARKSHSYFKNIGPSNCKYINDSLLIDMMLK